MNVRLRTAALDFWVDIRLVSWEDRWIATADIGGDLELGVGFSALDAVRAALQPLGESAASALVAESGLTPTR